MSEANIYVSNGTCYSAAGKELDSSFIPCGNDAFGHQTCCGKGDNCLADNACFGVHGSGYGSYLTYMAGCTDSEYKDSSCPNKEGIDQSWIALTLCDNTDIWAACSQEGNPTTLQPGSYCSCTDAASATIAFTDATSLTNIASLPQSTGASIQFFAGHIPTASSSGGTTASGAISSTATTAASTGSTTKVTQSTQIATTTDQNGSVTTATQTIIYTSSVNPTGSSSSSNGSSSTSGTKIGIGVGVGVGVILVLAALAAFFFYRRRKRRQTPTEIEKGHGGSSATNSNPVNPKVSTADDQDLSEADGKPVSRAEKLAMAEVGGQPLSEADGRAVSRADKLGMPEVDGTGLRPSSVRSELEGSPVTPTSAQSVGSFAGPGGVRKSGELSPVAELPGSSTWGSNRQGIVQETQAPAAIKGAGYAPAPGRSKWGEAWRKRST